MVNQRESPNAPVDSKGREKILIIGAGAAGMACAWSLARHPEKFAVTVWESEKQAGGVATSEELPNGQYINDGVQGGATSYRNSVMLHQEFGFETEPVGFRVCFGKGEYAWNNYAEDKQLSPLLQKLGPEIARFGRLLKWVTRFELIFIFVPIEGLLKAFRFSADFGDHMVYPLVALFFGTGNRTPQVSAAIIARVFLDPELCLFPYDPVRLIGSEAPMFAFKRLGDIYKKMTEGIQATFCFSRAVKCVVRSPGHVDATDEAGVTERFSQVVFACNADVALRLLEQPSFWERRCLGNVRYYDDVTITHQDGAYMREHYEAGKDLDECRRRREMYYIRTDPSDRKKIEMSFNLSAYQPQLKEHAEPIFQTIFLDKKGSDLWTIDEIDKDKVLMTKWWHQFAHEKSHFMSVVPFVRFIQNTKRSWYAGAYTLVNTHEIATISGLAVAHRLGAPYPFSHDKLANMQFKQYIGTIHGVGSGTWIIAICGCLCAIAVAVTLICIYA